jgi:hypothetical protein
MRDPRAKAGGEKGAEIGGRAPPSLSSLYRPRTSWTPVRRHHGHLPEANREGWGCHFSRCR